MGKFQKGHKINVGKKKKFHSEEAKLKMSFARKGKKWTAEVREKMKNRVPWNKGKKGLQKMSEARKEVLRQKMKGNQYTKGRVYSIETRKKFGSRKEKHHNWKGGVSTVNEQIRSSFEYRIWREAVFKRDDWKCIWCGMKGNVHADHIKPFCNYPELRFAIDNGRTLCESCHKKTDTWGSRASNY